MFTKTGGKFDLGTALRLGLWGCAAAIAIVTAVIATVTGGTNRPDIARPIAVASTPQGTPSPATTLPQGFDAQGEIRRLNDALRVLSTDRDRLYVRIGTLERSLDDVTGAIERVKQRSAAPPAEKPSDTIAPPQLPPIALPQVSLPKVTAAPSTPASTASAPQASAQNSGAELPKSEPPESDSLKSELARSEPSKPVAQTPATTPATPSPAAAQSAAPAPAATATVAAPSTPPARAPAPGALQTAAAFMPVGPSVVSTMAMAPAQLPPSSAFAAPESATPSSAQPSAAEPSQAAAPEQATPGAEMVHAVATGETHASESVASRTEFGVDLGSGASLDALRVMWRKARGSHRTLFEGLRPAVAVRESKPGAFELRLIAGPLANAGQAARICVSVVAAGNPCHQTVFDGQKLALR